MSGSGGVGFVYGNDRRDTIVEGAVIYPNLPLCVEKQIFGFSNMKCPTCTGMFSGHRKQAPGYGDIDFHYIEHESYCQSQPISQFSWLVKGCSTNAECSSLIRGNIWAVKASHYMDSDGGNDSVYYPVDDNDINRIRDRIQMGEKIPHTSCCEILGKIGLFAVMFIGGLLLIFP